MAYCIVCGAYAGEEDWRRWCRRCYAQKKQREERQEQGRQNEHYREIEGLKSDVQYWRNLALEYESKAAISSKTSLDGELIKRLLLLCHPDKHSNSPLSTKVTQELLGMRNRGN